MVRLPITLCVRGKLLPRARRGGTRGRGCQGRRGVPGMRFATRDTREGRLNLTVSGLNCLSPERF